MSAGGWIKSGIPIGGFRLIEVNCLASQETSSTQPVDDSCNNLNEHTYRMKPTHYCRESFAD
jgi:hypothetical protein